MCGDVTNTGAIFEDWWVHPDILPRGPINAMRSTGMDGQKIVGLT